MMNTKSLFMLCLAGVVLTAGSAMANYVVFTNHYMDRTNQNTVPAPGDIDQPLSIFAAPGEFEPAVFGVRANVSLTAVDVSLLADLETVSGDTIPSDRVEIRIATLMQVWEMGTQMECFLIQNRPIDISANYTQRYWLTVDVPGNAVPGDYSGTIRIDPANSSSYDLPISVEVLRVPLGRPEGQNYFQYFSFKWLPDDIRSKEDVARICRDMRDHGMTSLTLYGRPKTGGGPPNYYGVYYDDQVPDMPMGLQMEAVMETGLTDEWTQIPWYPAYVFDSGQWWHVWNAADEYGWPEMLLYMPDEPSSQTQFDHIVARDTTRDQMEIDYPDWAPIKMMTATGFSIPPSYIMDMLDIWLPLPRPHYNEGGYAGIGALIADANSKGKETWMYDPFLAGVDAHTDRYWFGVWCWKSGVTGAGHWAYYDDGMWNSGGADQPWTDTENQVTDLSHRHNLVYPMTDDLVPSIGWEAIREGVDDFRYIQRLEKLIAEGQANGVSGPLLTTAQNVLNNISGSIDIENLGDESLEGSWDGHFNRSPPEPALDGADYDQFRYDVAQQIVILSNEMILDVWPPIHEVEWQAGSATFDVTNPAGTGMGWTATVVEGSEWLSITSDPDGTGSGTLTVGYSDARDREFQRIENDEADRRGKIRVEAFASGDPNDVSTRDVIVIQEQMQQVINILWSEDFEGFADQSDYVDTDPEWSETGNSSYPSTFINEDSEGDKFADASHNDETVWGNKTIVTRNLTGEAAIAGNSDPIVDVAFNLGSGGISLANRHALYMQVLNDSGATVASLQYDYPDVIKFNGETVFPNPPGIAGSSGNHSITLDTDTGKVTAWIDGVSLDPSDPNSDHATEDFLAPMGPDELGGIRFQVIYYDIGGSSRTAGINLDDMVVRTITDVHEPEVCGDWGTVYLPADLNQDCDVNLADLVMFAISLLHCSDPEDTNCDQYWR